LLGTTNKDHTLGFQPEKCDSVLEEHHHKYCPPMLPPPLAEAIGTSHQTPGTWEEPTLYSLQPIYLSIITLNSQS
jgi:hypothetical protein